MSKSQFFSLLILAQTFSNLQVQIPYDLYSVSYNEDQFKEKAIESFPVEVNSNLDNVNKHFWITYAKHSPTLNLPKIVFPNSWSSKTNLKKYNFENYTLATLVLALDHLETAVSGFLMLKNDTELRSNAAKSKAFHLQDININR